MAVKSVRVFKEGFIGLKDYELCMKIDELIKLSEVKQSIPSLESTIYDLSDEDVEKIIKNKNTSGVDLKFSRLRGYQTFGLNFMLLAKNCLITDSVGLGKTVQVSAFVNYLHKEKPKYSKHPFKFIYLTELGLVEQAQKELTRFTGKVVLKSSGKKKDVDAIIEDIQNTEFTGIVASYSILSNFKFMSYLNKWVSENEKIDYMFVDESSVLKSSKVDTYKMMVTMRDKLTKNRILMNATPFESSIKTIYTQLNFVDPHALPYLKEFDRLFVKKHYVTGQIIGYKNPDLFKQAMRFVMFGKTRSSLGVEIKNSTLETIIYPLTEYQRNCLKNTSYYNMVYDDPTWFGEIGEFNTRVCPKAKVLIDLLIEKVLPSKVVIYCKYKNTQDNLKRILEDLGYQSLILNGDDDTSVKKAKKVKEFKENSDCPVLITNIQKGLNLEFVNHLVFYSFSTNSSIVAQVEGRIIRSQKINGKHIYLLLGRPKEYTNLRETLKNYKDRSSHTQTEISLVNLFLDRLDFFFSEVKDRNKADLLHFTYSIDGESGDYDVDTYVEEKEFTYNIGKDVKESRLK